MTDLLVNVEYAHSEGLELSNNLICKSAFISIRGDSSRIYYEIIPDDDNPQGPKAGFVFYVAHWQTMDVSTYDEWTPERTQIECLYEGVALFDGLRHVDNGHLYYPRPSDHIEIWKQLHQLEKIYCCDYKGEETI